MKSEDREDFELDEPAARTHTPPGWPIQTIEIVHSGKAPKKYGPRAYRFGAAMTLSVILPRRGWTLLKQTKNYAYLVPPPDQSAPPFYISVAVPTPEECLALARRSYTKGKSWFGQLGEWPAWYYHERNTDMREMWRDSETGEMASRLHPSPPQSSLSIGEWGAWNFDVTGVAGEFVTGILPPHLVQTQDTRSPTDNSPLSEGAVRTIELTTYERNEKARRLCIEHYGPTCRACGLNYETDTEPSELALSTYITSHRYLPSAKNTKLTRYVTLYPSARPAITSFMREIPPIHWLKSKGQLPCRQVAKIGEIARDPTPQTRKAQKL